MMLPFVRKKGKGVGKAKLVRTRQLPLRALVYLTGLAVTTLLLFFFELPSYNRELEKREIELVRLNYEDQTSTKESQGYPASDTQVRDWEGSGKMSRIPTRNSLPSNDTGYGRTDQEQGKVSAAPEPVPSIANLPRVNQASNRGEATPKEAGKYNPLSPFNQKGFRNPDMRDDQSITEGLLYTQASLSIVLYASSTAHTDSSDKNDTYFSTALQSYVRHTPLKNVFIFVDDPLECTSMGDVARQANCILVPCFHAKYGKPMMSCLFMTSHKLVQTEYVVFLTGHQILTKYFHAAFKTLAQVFLDFAMVGTTWEVDSSRAGLTWSTMLNNWNNDRPLYRTSYAQELNEIGFVLLRTNTLPPDDFPSFLTTGQSWASWLLSYLLSHKNTRVIDVSDVALVFRDKKRSQPPYTDLLSDLKIAMNESKAKKRLGDLANVDFYLAGKCPAPSCVLYPNKNSELVTAVHRHVSGSGHVTLLAFNHKSVSIARNWVCQAKSGGIGNFILLAEDLIGYNEMKDVEAPVVLMPDAPMREKVRKSSSPYADKMSSKLFGIALLILEMGVNVAISDIDTVWFEDVAPYMDKKCTVTMLDGDTAPFSDALVAIQADNPGLNFWKEVVKCLAKDASYAPLMQLRKTQRWQSSWKNTCLSFLFEQGRKKDTSFSVCYFSNPLFSTNAEFLHGTQYQQEGIWPTFIHTGWGGGTEFLEHSLKKWQVWRLSNNGICTVHSTPSHVLPPALDEGSITLLISILTSVNPDGLVRLLGQLQSATYTQPGRQITINLEILVEQPSAPVSTYATSMHRKCLKFANDYVWERGSFHVCTSDGRKGAFEKLLGTWLPSSDREFRLVLDESSEVSPLFASVIFELLDKYYFDAANFNPQIFGFCIQRQHSVLSQKAVNQDIPKLVGKRSVYGYQLYGGFGTLFFPSHWERFQDWAVEGKFLWRKLCLPQIVSNQWIAEKKGGYAALMALITRFVFDEGWYFLFLNIQDGSTLMSSWKEKEHRVNLGLRTHSSRGNDAFFATNDSLENFMPPDLPEVPVYDLHLHRIMHSQQLLQRKVFLANLNTNQLCTLA